MEQFTACCTIYICFHVNHKTVLFSVDFFAQNKLNKQTKNPTHKLKNATFLYILNINTKSILCQNYEKHANGRVKGEIIASDVYTLAKTTKK